MRVCRKHIRIFFCRLTKAILVINKKKSQPCGLALISCLSLQITLQQEQQYQQQQYQQQQWYQLQQQQ